jgi:hypothetical protein
VLAAEYDSFRDRQPGGLERGAALDRTAPRRADAAPAAAAFSPAVTAIATRFQFHPASIEPNATVQVLVRSHNPIRARGRT